MNICRATILISILDISHKSIKIYLVIKAFWKFVRSRWLAALAVVFLLCQLLFLAEGRLSNSFILSNQEDEIALQGKEATSPERQRFAGLAGRQNNQAGGIPVAFGENAPDTLPARVGAAAADPESGVLSPDSAVPRLVAAQSGDAGPVPGQEGQRGAPGQPGRGGQPGGPGQEPGKERPFAENGPGEMAGAYPPANGTPSAFGLTHLEAGEQRGIPDKNSIPLDSLATYKEDEPSPEVKDVSASPSSAQDASVAKKVKKPAIKVQKVSGQPQRVQNRLDSGSSYDRGLRMIYFLERKGGRLALSGEQATYLLKLIREMEGLRHGDTPVVEVEPVKVAVTPVNIGKGVPIPPKEKGKATPKHKGVGTPPKEKGQGSPPASKGKGVPPAAKGRVAPGQHGDGQRDDGDSYRHAFLLLYALEQKGGRYAVTPSQAKQLLRLINVAEAQKTVVPDAQRNLPNVLTSEQQSFIRAALSVEAAKGKRTDPALLNSYADEVLRLTK